MCLIIYFHYYKRLGPLSPPSPFRSPSPRSTVSQECLILRPSPSSSSPDCTTTGRSCIIIPCSHIGLITTTVLWSLTEPGQLLMGVTLRQLKEVISVLITLPCWPGPPPWQSPTLWPTPQPLYLTTNSNLPASFTIKAITIVTLKQPIPQIVLFFFRKWNYSSFNQACHQEVLLSIYICKLWLFSSSRTINSMLPGNVKEIGYLVKCTKLLRLPDKLLLSIFIRIFRDKMPDYRYYVETGGHF